MATILLGLMYGWFSMRIISKQVNDDFTKSLIIFGVWVSALIVGGALGFSAGYNLAD